MGGTTSRAMFALCAVAAIACDSRAKASDPAGGRAEAKSKEHESCGASMHCQDDLRCFDQVCRKTTRSAVGDYYAALGTQLRGRGELNAAIEAFNKSLGHYQTEKIDVPADIDCAYGSTLAAARQKKEHAELGARVLHRCVLAVPTASSLRQRAMSDLALLTESGLDPLHIGRMQLADVYLTGAPAKPGTDKLTVNITPNPPVDKKTFPLIIDRLAQPDLKPAFIACWEAYNQATKKDAMSASIGLKSGYVASEYEDEPGKYVLKIEPAAPGAGAEEACVRAAAEPAIKAVSGIRDSFQTKLTITVK